MRSAASGPSRPRGGGRSGAAGRRCGDSRRPRMSTSRSVSRSASRSKHCWLSALGSSRSKTSGGHRSVGRAPASPSRRPRCRWCSRCGSTPRDAASQGMTLPSWITWARARSLATSFQGSRFSEGCGPHHDLVLGEGVVQHRNHLAEAVEERSLVGGQALGEGPRQADARGAELRHVARVGAGGTSRFMRGKYALTLLKLVLIRTNGPRRSRIALDLGREVAAAARGAAGRCAGCRSRRAAFRESRGGCAAASALSSPQANKVAIRPRVASETRRA